MLPTSTRILSLARERKLVGKLEGELARARERRQLPLAFVLEQAIPLGQELESEICALESTEPDPGTADRLLEKTLTLSRKLGPMLNRARELEED